MGQKGTGRRLSDQERIEIIAKLEGDKPRASAAECARQYGVSSAAITKLMKMKDKVKQRFQEHNAFSQQRKRGGTERHAAFEDELFQWITAQQQQQQQHQQTLEAAAATGDDASHVAPLTSAKVQEKAHELLKIHDLGSFRASKGWYYRFCRRYGLSRSSLAGDDADADDDADHALDHSGGEDSDGSFAAGDHHSVDGGEGQDAARARATNKRKESGRSTTATGWRKKTKTNATATQGWAVQSLQDTLAKAALALDHPQAREYLGEPAACEMLRSIQQSIGVVQCIQLKKAATPESSDASVNAPVEAQDESSADTLDATAPLVQESPDAAVAVDAVEPDAHTEAGALDDVIV